MSVCKRSEMQYDDYSWTTIPGDDPRITGSLDATMFSRKEGFEVLYLINKFMEIHDLKNKETCNKIERMLHDHLPSNTRSQENVKDWLKKIWKNH